MKKALLIALMAIVTLTNTAQAGNTASFTVTCTVPFTPGINAPLLEKAALETKDKVSVEKTKTGDQASEEAPEMIQQETQASGDNVQSATLVKTLYTR